MIWELKYTQLWMSVLFDDVPGVIPDDAMGYQLIEIFGQHGHAFRKYQRMMYWMPKFRYSNPYYVPHELPSDDTELARLALQRMSVDLENKISTFMTKDLESSNDHTSIVSGQSPVQSALIAELPRDKPIFVEGGHTVWMRSRCLTYFILRADCSDRYKRFQTKAPDEDMFQWSIFEEESPKILAVPPSAHEQDDGTVLAMCITGTSSKDSLASWIKFLERNNPALSEIPVVFLLRSPATEILTSEDVKKQRTKSSELMN